MPFSNKAAPSCFGRFDEHDPGYCFEACRREVMAECRRSTVALALCRNPQAVSRSLGPVARHLVRTYGYPPDTVRELG